MIDQRFLFAIEARLAAIDEPIEQVDVLLAEDESCAVIYVYGAHKDYVFSTDTLPADFVEDEYRTAVRRLQIAPAGTIN